MRVLLDEGVTPRLAKALSAFGIAAEPFPRVWKGLRNGRLLARAYDQGFAALLTNDRNIRFQQNLATLQIALVALPTSRPRAVLPRAHDIAATLAAVEQGDYIVMNFDGSRSRTRQGVVAPLSAIAAFR
jgi:hypothetical protein